MGASFKHEMDTRRWRKPGKISPERFKAPAFNHTKHKPAQSNAKMAKANYAIKKKEITVIEGFGVALFGEWVHDFSLRSLKIAWDSIEIIDVPSAKLQANGNLIANVYKAVNRIPSGAHFYYCIACTCVKVYAI